MPETSAPADPQRALLDALGPLLRPELRDLVAYVPHEPPGIEVKLDANEAPPSRSQGVREAMVRAISAVSLERYPDPRALRLKEAIAKRTGARPDDLLIGTGSDEVIALVLNAFARPRKRNPQAVVLTPIPTFVMYRITARAHGVKPVEVPLDAAWDLDVDAMKRGISMMEPNVVAIASPNNPTGNRVDDGSLDEILAACAPDRAGCFAIVDEAYVDYAGDFGGSIRTWRARHPHLGILRTLSKVGLAALRVGWMEADCAIVGEIDKTRQPFNVSATTQAAAAAVLEEAWDELQSDVARVVASRAVLSAEIASLPGFSVTPSAANFLWVKTPSPAEHVSDHLVKDGILVRSFHGSGGRLGAQLRITLGTDAQHDRLASSLRRFQVRA